MKRIVPVVMLAGWILTAAAMAGSPAPAPVLPDSLTWVSPPNTRGFEAAWVLGREQEPGPYILRVRLASGGRIPPHTHPDERNTTVLAGTIHVGFGEIFDETKLVAIPRGAVYVVPAGVPHYVWAQDGAAEYQEAGMGPTGTSFIK